MVLTRKQEEVKRRNQMAVFKITEKDTTILKIHKRYQRRIKIGKIFDIEVPKKVINFYTKNLVMKTCQSNIYSDDKCLPNLCRI
jgi:hypothetical protein